MSDHRPCRVCGGTDFDINEWELQFDNVTAIECKNCLLSAPIDTWDRPTHLEIGALLASEKNEPVNYRGFDITMAKDPSGYGWRAAAENTDMRAESLIVICQRIDKYHGPFTGVDSNAKCESGKVSANE